MIRVCPLSAGKKLEDNNSTVATKGGDKPPKLKHLRVPWEAGLYIRMNRETARLLIRTKLAVLSNEASLVE